jgi:sugar O-acyltransferase (sialic acid O-acetyltransferase NeuD family)
MIRYLVWGAGGHARVVADLIRAAGGSVAGFVDSNYARVGQQVEPGGGRVVWDEAALHEALQSGDGISSLADYVALAIGDNPARLLRSRTIARLSAPPLNHPFAVVSPSARLGPGTVVMAGVVINAGAIVGEAVIANTSCVIEHDCRIADGAHISPGAVLAGGVAVGEAAWIGAGATVIQGIVIGDGAVVGAGAVVIRDVPPHAVVAGVPAVPIRSQRAG